MHTGALIDALLLHHLILMGDMRMTGMLWDPLVSLLLWFSG